MKITRMLKAKIKGRNAALMAVESILILSVVVSAVAFSFGSAVNNDYGSTGSEIPVIAPGGEPGALELSAFNPDAVSVNAVTMEIVNGPAPAASSKRLPALPKTITVRSGLWDSNGMLNWNANQFLPQTQTPAEVLDYIAYGKLNAAERSMFVSLQGIVNKRQPRIFLTEHPPEFKYQAWESDLDLKFFRTEEPYSLITKYAKEIKGIIIYDDRNVNVQDTLNIATSIAGIKNAIIVNDTLFKSEKMKALIKRHRFKTVLDMRRKFYDKWEIYEYMIDEYLDTFTDRVLVNLSPNVRHHIRDYAIAINAPVVNLDPSLPRDSVLIESFLKRMPEGQGVVLGEWPDGQHISGSQDGTKYGIVTLRSNDAQNVSVYAGYKDKIKKPKSQSKVKLQNKSYVALVMGSDGGDSLNNYQKRMHKLWHDPFRGEFPMSYTISPLLIDVGPKMLNWYYETASKTDSFVASPSGAGFLIPTVWGQEKYADNPAALSKYTGFKRYLKRSNSYMSRAGLRSMTIWNGNAQFTKDFAQMYAENMPALVGATVQGPVQRPDPGLYNKNKFVVKQIELADGTATRQFENEMNRVIENHNGRSPKFYAFQGLTENEAPMGVLRNWVYVRDMADVRVPGGVEFVSFTQLLELQREHLAKTGGGRR
ncbi:MAG: hypothetical protein FWG69_01225 [Oscillospiraceae bacterium]|nr:hypothetical protein [Oscillospiraceae bacterium]